MTELKELTKIQGGSSVLFSELVQQINSNLEYLNNKVDAVITNAETKRKGYQFYGTFKDIFNVDTYTGTGDKLTKIINLPFECTHGRVYNTSFDFSYAEDYPNGMFLSQKENKVSVRKYWNSSTIDFELLITLLDNNTQLKFELYGNNNKSISLADHYVSIELY